MTISADHALPNPSRHWIVLGAIFAALSVVAGAFGAHYMESLLEGADAGPRRLAAWKTAAQYQFLHSLGLVLLGQMATTNTRSQFSSGLLMVVGILIFSGVLYAYSLTYIKVLGAIVPLGGVCMIASWCLFAIAATGAIQQSPGSNENRNP